MLATNDLIDAAQILSALIDSQARDLGVTLPARRVVSSGGAVYDCEMVAVSTSQVLIGLPTSPEGGLESCAPAAWTVQGEMAIVRCAHEVPEGPRGELPPKTENILADAAAMSADAAVLVAAVQMYADVSRSATLSVAMGSPQGGLIAVVASYSVPLWPDALAMPTEARGAIPETFWAAARA